MSLDFTNLPLRVQIPVRKQGTVKKAQWSTRILTIDAATATVTISRHKHPNNIFYHTLRVEYVQMWPRFGQSLVAEDFYQLETKLTLRIAGENVAVPNLSDGAARMTQERAAAECTPTTTTTAAGKQQEQSANSSPSPSFTTTPNTSADSSTFCVTASDSAKVSRPLSSSMNWITDSWMIQFTTFESYELAVRMLLRMRSTDHIEVGSLCPHAKEDLQAIKVAYLTITALRNVVK